MTVNMRRIARLTTCAVLICIPSVWNASAMTPEQIDQAIAKGRQAAKEKDVPGAITVGRDKPAGDYLFELLVSRFTPWVPRSALLHCDDEELPRMGATLRNHSLLF